MSRKFILTDQALDDLRSIAKHYRRDGSNDRIEAWLNGLVAAVEDLADESDQFPVAAEAARLGFDLRQKLYGTRQHRYRILFAIVPDAVRVLRIWHGARAPLTTDDLDDPTLAP